MMRLSLLRVAWWPTVIVASVGIGLALAPAVVRAADADAAADATQARAHFERGKRYFQVDEFRKAIEEFKAAHVEKADPAFLYNIAECHRRLGESRDALVYYRRFLSLSPPNDPARPTARKRIAELESRRQAPAPGPEAAPPSLLPPAVPPTTAPPPLVEAPAATVAVPAAHAEAPDAPRPLYKRGWFYAALGAVAVAGAVGVWALSSRGGTDLPTTPLGNMPIF